MNQRKHKKITISEWLSLYNIPSEKEEKKVWSPEKEKILLDLFKDYSLTAIMHKIRRLYKKLGGNEHTKNFKGLKK